MGIRRKLMAKVTKIGVEKEGMIVGWIKQGMERWRIVGIYVREGIENMLKGVEKWMEKKEEGVKILVGGDFNARIEREARGLDGSEGGEEEGRRSKDGKINSEDRKLIEFIEERGWCLFNGNVKGGEEGEYTFTGVEGKGVR